MLSAARVVMLERNRNGLRDRAQHVALARLAFDDRANGGLGEYPGDLDDAHPIRDPVEHVARGVDDTALLHG